MVEVAQWKNGKRFDQTHCVHTHTQIQIANTHLGRCSASSEAVWATGSGHAAFSGGRTWCTELDMCTTQQTGKVSTVKPSNSSQAHGKQNAS